MGQALAEELEHNESAEKERVASVPQREQLASTPDPPCQKEKEQSRLFKASNREVGESQGERVPHLGEKEGSKREHGEEKVDFAVKEDRFQGRERWKTKRVSLGKVEGNMSR